MRGDLLAGPTSPPWDEVVRLGPNDPKESHQNISNRDLEINEEVREPQPLPLQRLLLLHHRPLHLYRGPGGGGGNVDPSKQVTQRNTKKSSIDTQRKKENLTKSSKMQKKVANNTLSCPPHPAQGRWVFLANRRTPDKDALAGGQKIVQMTWQHSKANKDFANNAEGPEKHFTERDFGKRVQITVCAGGSQGTPPGSSRPGRRGRSPVRAGGRCGPCPPSGRKPPPARCSAAETDSPRCASSKRNCVWPCHWNGKWKHTGIRRLVCQKWRLT